MIESGANVAPAARRAWLFRVAANESARLWRSKASTDKMIERHGGEEAAQVDPTVQTALMTGLLMYAIAEVAFDFIFTVRRLSEHLRPGELLAVSLSRRRS